MRLIDADALKKSLDEQMHFEENCRDSVFDIIDNAPTVDINKWLNPDIDPELALENIRRIVYERGEEE